MQARRAPRCARGAEVLVARGDMALPAFSYPSRSWPQEADPTTRRGPGVDSISFTVHPRTGNQTPSSPESGIACRAQLSGGARSAGSVLRARRPELSVPALARPIRRAGGVVMGVPCPLTTGACLCVARDARALRRRQRSLDARVGGALRRGRRSDGRARVGAEECAVRGGDGGGVQDAGGRALRQCRRHGLARIIGGDESRLLTARKTSSRNLAIAA
ncbi:hypothetical protein C2845_PM11G12720 [Panicum miliaceum]|uniref:Uncharacterized protein n=1 Tax=Panicum miliaceum TaxID=4540 RepID=A0A3L6RU14_PANMI|nr:hypothetical protein C2845_PM11G12720 [Panicum miliaceum]